MNTRQDEYSYQQQQTPPSASSLYPYHQQSFHHFSPQQTAPPPPPKLNGYGPVQYPDYGRRSVTSPVAPSSAIAPPVPAKPIEYPALGANSYYSTSVRSTYPAGQYASPTTTSPVAPPYSSSAASYSPPLPRSPPWSVQQDYRPTNTQPSHSPPIAHLPSNPYANAAPSSYSTPLSIPSQPIPQEDDCPTSPGEDSDELAMVLALSQSESAQRTLLVQQMLDQEEQDLARALAESMLSGGSDIAMDNAFLPSPEEVTSTSQITQGNASVQLSPLQLATSLNYQVEPFDDLETPVASTTSHRTGSSSSNADFDFGIGRYEKWHIPGGPGGAPQAVASQSEVAGGKRPSFSQEPQDQPNQVTRSSTARPTSIASASSLPYTQDTPERKSSLPLYSQMDGRDSPTSHTTEQLSPTAIGALESLQHTETAESKLVFDDEAYARQLAEEEEDELRWRIDNKGRQEERREEQIASGSGSGSGGGPPVYSSQSRKPSVGQIPGGETPDWSAPPTPTSRLKPKRPSTSSGAGPSRSFHAMEKKQSLPRLDEGQRSPSSAHVPEYSPPLPNKQNHQLPPGARPPMPAMSSSSSIPMSPPVVYPALGVRRESDADARSVSSYQSSAHSIPTTSSVGPQSSQSSISHPPSSSHSNALAGPSNSSQPSTAGMLNANHFLDHELLMGVSIGFKPPAITERQIPMQDPMPNIISLPYSRCPPLHLQAPDWRHLLRLMARLSGTRIEPTVEAMAVSKTELKLRTVVQFIKPYPHASSWRTVLWFSLDHPVPPNAPGATRYNAGNINLLPWSYTLSPVPMLLRDAADTQISKTYTIPASDSVPLPTLPITFPNLALYLQAALVASRRHHSDGTGGLGKLGKMVQMCYPNTEAPAKEDDFDIPDRSGMGNLFKRVIGLGHSKDKKKGKGGSNNEETYQLVTPFVPEEWG